MRTLLLLLVALALGACSSQVEQNGTRRVDAGAAYETTGLLDFSGLTSLEQVETEIARYEEILEDVEDQVGEDEVAAPAHLLGHRARVRAHLAGLNAMAERMRD